MLNADVGWSDALNTTTTTTAAFPKDTPLNVVQGDGTCSTKDNDGGNGLWEPWCPDPYFRPAPNVSSTTEFPRLEHGNPAFRKNM